MGKVKDVLSQVYISHSLLLRITKECLLQTEPNSMSHALNKDNNGEALLTSNLWELRLCFVPSCLCWGVVV